MADTLFPFVYWGQTSDHISLKINLRDVTIEDVTLTEDGLLFTAEGVGVKGRNQYGFDLQFYLPVDPDKSQYRVMDRGIEFHIEKKGDGEVWPRLTAKQMKYPWLKIDFDKFAFEDLSDSDQEPVYDQKKAEAEAMQQIQRELLDDLDAQKGKSQLDIPKLYLFLYNMFQFVGFSYIFVTLAYRLAVYREDALLSGMESVGMQIMVCQGLAVLEIVHPLLGLVKSGIISPFMQWFGRCFVLFVLVLSEQRLHSTPAVTYLILIWSLIEVIRYPYYIATELSIKSDLLTWLRYTAWIPLYPIGILLEGTIVILSIPLFEETEWFSFRLPNSANMAFYFPWFLHIYLFISAVGGYMLLNHMYEQRKKKLSFKPRINGTKKKH